MDAGQGAASSEGIAPASGMAATPRVASDRALLARYARDGSEAELEELVRRYAGMVHATCRRILGNDAAADDAAQATFLIMIRKARALDRVRLPQWLHVTARQTALVHARSLQRRARHERAALADARRSPATIETPAAPDHGPLLAALDGALAALNAGQRDAIALRFLRGLSLAEAAAAAGCPLRTFQTRMRRGLERLRTQLQAAVPAQACTLAMLPPLLERAADLQPHHALAQAVLRGAAPGAAATTTAHAIVARLLRQERLRIVGGIGALAAGLALSCAAAAWSAERAQREPGPGAPPPSAVASARAASPLRDAGAWRAHDRDGVRALAMSPDGALLASGGSDGTVRVWSWSQRRQLARAEGTTAVNAVAFSPTGDLLASTGFDGAVRLWSAKGALLAQLVAGATMAQWALAFSPDGMRLAAAGDDSRLRIWDVRRRTLASVNQVSSAALRCVAWSADGRLIAVGGNDDRVTLWDAHEQRQIDSWTSGSAPLALAFRPDGACLAIGSWSDRIRLVALPGHSRPEVTLPEDAVHALAWVDDHRLLAVDHHGDEVLWDAERGTEIARQRSHGELISLAVSPDGGHAAVGSWDDGDIRALDIASAVSPSDPTVADPTTVAGLGAMPTAR
jgi:RNA polymerase sigma factor (sigma-70 family)